MHALLRASSSGFVLVAGPQPSALEEALYFHRRLEEKRMPFVSFVVNRVHLDPAREGGPSRRTRLALDPGLAERLARALAEQQVLAGVERRAIARLEVDTREKPLLVPELTALLTGSRTFGVLSKAAPPPAEARLLFVVVPLPGAGALAAAPVSPPLFFWPANCRAFFSRSSLGSTSEMVSM